MRLDKGPAELQELQRGLGDCDRSLSALISLYGPPLALYAPIEICELALDWGELGFSETQQNLEPGRS